MSFVLFLPKNCLDKRYHHKEWVDESLAILLIRCLFQAVVDLQQVKYLKVLVALRSNIFQQLNYDKQSRGGQEEKFRGLALDIRWTVNDLRELLNARAEVASRFYQIDPPKTLTEMLPNVNKRSENPLFYILDRTLMRPRDAILYLNSCVREATGKDKITWENIHQAERTYSNERLLALRDEWKDPYLGIDKVFEKFQRKPARLNETDITEILEEIALLPADQSFSGSNWLNPICEPIFAPDSAKKTWYEIYGQLISLLYTIGFIGIVKGSQGRAQYSYENPGFTLFNGKLPENVYFEIHPAFRQALNSLEKQN